MDTRDEFYAKFVITRRDTGEEVDPATCFTLIPADDPAAVVALEAYAAEVEVAMPGLARDLRERLIPQGRA
jgi:hypothetical protein